MSISQSLHEKSFQESGQAKKSWVRPHKEMSKTRDKTGWNTGRKSEKAKGGLLLSCSLGSYGEKLKLTYPEREPEERKKFLQARSICNGLRKKLKK